MKHDYDIIVAGAGPAGLSFARLAADAGLSILLIEKQDKKSISHPEYDGREIALTHLSHKIMKDCGMWQRISEKNISKIRDAKVVNGESPYALHFSSDGAGKENLGFMISNHLIRKAAYESAIDCKNVKLFTGLEVTTAHTNDRAAYVTLSDGKKFSCRLLVAADSRFSRLRDMMGIGAAKLDFDRLCIVSRMKIEKAHDDVAYECFHNDRTVAILPLNDDHCSIVVTADTEDGKHVMEMGEVEFAKDIAGRIDNKHGEMKLVSKRYAYPLVSVYANRFHARRFALLGDAAVGMHPVTAHGFNFGLRGGHTLASEMIRGLKLGLDIADETILHAYNNQHRLATWPIYQGTNTIVKLYTDTRPFARFARGALLRLGNKLTPAHKMIMQQLTEAN